MQHVGREKTTKKVTFMMKIFYLPESLVLGVQVKKISVRAIKIAPTSKKGVFPCDTKLVKM